MELNLKGRTALVTGGTKGIGLAIAQTLAAEGMSVVAGARTAAEVDGVTVVPVDLSTAEGPAALVAAAVELFSGLDVIVNNVGVSEPGTSVLSFTDDAWQRIFDATFFSAVRVVRAAVPHLREGGSIVNISSLNARVPAGMIAPYSAAKAALTNLGTMLSEELAPAIRVNTVSPGPVRTPLWTGERGFAHVFAAQLGTTAQDVMDRVLPETMSITAGRVGEPREVADLVAFLASERAAWITGADYVIDGGMYKTA
ncbi:SDR family oxidoreductase [Actinophytocola glycyrrhizae]|uniref:SDR family oxidoreductase n=1 Tax=Actinophytocola glycyrrhizae TaxID=2044873 RepID=A0ABV9RXJ4_9PSEU